MTLRLSDPAVVAAVDALYEDTKAALDLAEMQLNRAQAAHTLASRIQDMAHGHTLWSVK